MSLNLADLCLFGPPIDVSNKLPLLPQADFHGPIKLGCPFGGLLTNLAACNQLCDAAGVSRSKIEAVLAYDTDETLEHVVKREYPNLKEENVAYNKDSGDVLKKRIEELAEPDVLVGGPPCPPWAGNGKANGVEDGRAACYDTILEWLREWFSDPNGRLIGAAIENVEGVLKKLRSQGGRAYIEIVREKLKVPGVHVEVFVKSARECGLPQTRMRVWVVAVRSSVLKELGVAPGAVRDFLTCKISSPPDYWLCDLLNPDRHLRKERNDIGTSIMRSPRRNTNSNIYAVRSNML